MMQPQQSVVKRWERSDTAILIDATVQTTRRNHVLKGIVTMKTKTIEHELYNFIREHDATSFVELESLFKRIGYDYQGEREIGIKSLGNVVLWSGWSADAVKIFDNVMKLPDVGIMTVSPLIYFMDGAVPQLPVVKRDQSYKHPHWLPIAFTVNRE